jgi:hypothetical protein
MNIRGVSRRAPFAIAPPINNEHELLSSLRLRAFARTFFYKQNSAETAVKKSENFPAENGRATC